MRQVRPPVTIEDEQFVVLYDRDDESFTLALRSGSTFNLGNNEEATRYLKNAIPVEDKFWIEEIIDRAYSFHGAQVIIPDRAIVQVDFRPKRNQECDLIFSQPKDRSMTLLAGALA